MSNGTSAAVTEAARLNEIGFPEVTAKLITDALHPKVAETAGAGEEAPKQQLVGEIEIIFAPLGREESE
ncbi:MAG: hypothetical protein ACOYU4_10630 [Thermodesulfobacteriota bacterium]